MFALNDKWIWDFWLYQDGDHWHLYYLQADKSLKDPELRHWNVSQGHAISTDLQHWDNQGTCLAPAQGPAWDDKTTWTGSVIKDDSGLWHLFYTGTCEAERGMKQRIGHATSTDGHHWERLGNGLALDLDPELYEEYEQGQWHDRAMRDPWVMKDPDGDGWLMYFTARVMGRDEPNDGGAIGLARSADLTHWTLEKPVYAGQFGQLEVPQVFKHGAHWYCLFCTAGEHWSTAYAAASPTEPVGGTHYLMADHHLGPWRLAPGSFLDGANPVARYAGKIIRQTDELAFMGFWHDTPDGTFIGQVSDPVPVRVNAEGLLHLTD
ncbi:levansucrase [Saccharospirillum impatiens]|uniref:levansucrase n=1 Tax=Saccharospirillum impatiens TaxID=169438 RepID=UPI0003FF6025|nr:levansucrase [Saccharospirillum impatiens]